MMWPGICSKGVSPLVISEDGAVHYERHIHGMLPLTLKFGKHMFGNNWIFQKDKGRPHIHQKTQDWCRTHLPSFINKER